MLPTFAVQPIVSTVHMCDIYVHFVRVYKNGTFSRKKYKNIEVEEDVSGVTASVYGSFPLSLLASSLEIKLQVRM